MAHSRLQLSAILVAAGMLFLIATGAAVTSLHDQPGQALFANLHRSAALAMALLSAGFFIWMMLASKRRALILLTGVILIVGFVDAWLGTSRLLGSSPTVIGTVHAWLAALLFAAIAAIAWSVSPAFHRAPDLVQDHGWPSLQFLTAASVVLLAAQIEVGAGYRHSALTVMPHLLGAPVVALIVMIAGAFVAQQFPKHGSLRPMAVALLIATSVQVGLGLTTLIVGLTQSATAHGAVLIRVAHVVTGSLTLALSLVLAIEVRRKVYRSVSS